MTAIRYVAIILLAAGLLGGCATPVDPMQAKQRQLQLERMQTKVIDTRDRNALLRGVITSFQDLNFVIANADSVEGSVVAKKYGAYPIVMTVTVEPLSNTQIKVRGIARHEAEVVEDPFLYEQFFSSLQSFIPPVGRTGP